MNAAPNLTAKASKYDFVKVRVWLTDDHYHVLSRYLVSRVLTVVRIPVNEAIRISLELKKLLVDEELLDITQSELDSRLFLMLEQRGYEAQYRARYRMMSQFHLDRIPLIILIGGAPLIGKSLVATRLANRLNMPRLLQTNIIFKVAKTLDPRNVRQRDSFLSEHANNDLFLEAFREECKIVRRGIDVDIQKCMRDGKSLIVEGVHLDPASYADLIERSTLRLLHERKQLPQTSKAIIVPFIMRQKSFEESMLAHNFFASTKTFSPTHLLNNLQALQNHLCSQAANSAVAIVDAEQDLSKTAESMHRVVLECIERVYKPAIV